MAVYFGYNYTYLTHLPLFSIFSSVTTAGAVVRGRTVLAHFLALTVVAHRLGDIHSHPSSPTSSPKPATMATVTPNLADVTATAVVATRGSKPALGHGPALR